MNPSTEIGGPALSVRQLAGSLGLTQSPNGQPWQLGERIYSKAQNTNAFAAAGSALITVNLGLFNMQPNQALLVESLGGDIVNASGAGGPVNITGVEAGAFNTGQPVLNFPIFASGASIPAATGASASFYVQPPAAFRNRDVGNPSGGFTIQVQVTLTNTAGVVTIAVNAQLIARIITGVAT